MPVIRIWQTTHIAAPRQCLIHTNPCSAAFAISTLQDYYPNVWSNSSSGIGSASTPAMCTNRSCPASALRFAVWSNSSPGIASNTAFGAASRCANSISSGGERAGAIAGALDGLMASNLKTSTIYSFKARETPSSSRIPPTVAHGLPSGAIKSSTSAPVMQKTECIVSAISGGQTGTASVKLVRSERTFPRSLIRIHEPGWIACLRACLTPPRSQSRGSSRWPSPSGLRSPRMIHLRSAR